MHVQVAGLDIKVVGIILMAAGALGLVLTLVALGHRRRRTVTEFRGAQTLEPIVGSSTVTTEDVSGPPTL